MKQSTEFQPISQDCGCTTQYSKNCRDHSAKGSHLCRRLRQAIHLKFQQETVEPYEWDLFAD